MALRHPIKRFCKKVLPEEVVKAAKYGLSPIHSFYAYKLRKLIESGEVAIIPVGFRCFTKEHLYPKLGISQPSLPFDSGFFSPYSVGEILRKQRINLKFNDPSSQTVCIKTEHYTDNKLGLGVKFETSTYDEINRLAMDKDQKDINKYLDSTFGYYTLDIDNHYVLAHYNWHMFADKSYSKGCVEPEHNLVKINELMNRRVQRLVRMCNNAKIVFFVYDETQGYNFIAIDGSYFDLRDLEPIETVVRDKFKAKSVIIRSKEIKSPSHILKLIKCNW